MIFTKSKIATISRLYINQFALYKYALINDNQYNSFQFLYRTIDILSSSSVIFLSIKPQNIYSNGSSETAILCIHSCYNWAWKSTEITMPYVGSWRCCTNNITDMGHFWTTYCKVDTQALAAPGVSAQRK